MSIGSQTITEDLGVNPGAAFFRRLVFFEDNDTGAFTHNKAVTVLVKRPARSHRVIVARRQRLHNGETANPEWTNRRLAATGNNRICIAALNHAKSITDRVRACGTG